MQGEARANKTSIIANGVLLHLVNIKENLKLHNNAARLSNECSNCKKNFELKKVNFKELEIALRPSIVQSNGHPFLFKGLEPSPVQD